MTRGACPPADPDVALPMSCGWEHPECRAEEPAETVRMGLHFPNVFF